MRLQLPLRDGLTRSWPGTVELGRTLTRKDTRDMSYFSHLDTWLTERLQSLEPQKDIGPVKKALADEILASYRHGQKARPAPKRRDVPPQS